jgi:hypothetical protein
VRSRTPPAGGDEPLEEGALEDPEIGALRRKVATMRELGVERWGDIHLGPPPPPASKAEKPAEPMTREEIAKQRLAVLLRSSGVQVTDSFTKRYIELEMRGEAEDPEEAEPS